MVPRSKATRILHLYLALAATVFCASTVLRPSPGYNSFLDGWLFTSISVVVAVLCGMRFFSSRTPERWAWLCLSAAITAWTMGGVIWAALLEISDEPPQPSWADAGWLATYPLAYVAILLLLRQRVNQVPRSLWLDGLVGALAVAAVASAIAFEPIAKAASGSDAAIIVNLAYPLADFLLLALVVGSFGLNGWRPDRSFLVLGGGMLLFAVSDTLYLFEATRGIVEEGTWLDAPWTIGLVAIGFAPYVTSKRSSAMANEHWSVIAMPITFGCAALGVLAFGQNWDGSSLGVVLACAAVLVGFTRMVVTLREVHTLAQSKIEARTDDLTNLGNRRLFYERSNALLHKRGNDQPLALLLVDLDKFKEVNDSLGHHLGDIVLAQMAPRLTKAFPQAAVIARLGGDEFAIVLDQADATAASYAIDAVHQALLAPFRLEGLPVKLQASIGVALFPDHGCDANELLQHADVAMYSAKKEQLGSKFYESVGNGQSRERLKEIADLRKCLETQRLMVQYQPKVDAVTGRLVGVEALCRLNHPQRGVLAPFAFLPLAEEAGLMRLLTAELLKVVFADAIRWNAKGREFKIAVNLSMTNLLDAEFPTYIANEFARTGLSGKQFTFEITEDIVLGDPARAREAANQLRALGSHVSLDDYGTGFTSLAYLRQMPLDELKLDRSFVSNMTNDPIAELFVSNAVEVAHVMGLKVVAEGIETPDMWEAVRQAGVDICQGFFFAKPLTEDVLMRYLDEEDSRLSAWQLNPVVATMDSDRGRTPRHFRRSTDAVIPATVDATDS